jgi:hypothetical protein
MDFNSAQILMSVDSHICRVTVMAADSLFKRDILKLPDPFAVVTFRS